MNANEPAFPQWDGHAITSEPLYLRGGMSLRAYFAGKALPAVIAYNDRQHEERKSTGQELVGISFAQLCAKDAVEISDALIAACLSGGNPKTATEDGRISAGAIEMGGKKFDVRYSERHP